MTNFISTYLTGSWLDWVILYCGVAYAVSAVWFLILNRNDSLLRWRLLSWAVSPIAMPILFGILVILKIFDHFKPSGTP